MYDVTLHALKAARIERLWFIVSLKLARLHLDARRVVQACLLINELHRSVVYVCTLAVLSVLHARHARSVCTLPGSDADDPAKAAQLIELYAMRIEVNPALCTCCRCC